MGSAMSLAPSISLWGVEKFRRQMKFLSEHYSVISIQELETIVREGKPVQKDLFAITFDDNYRDNYSSAYPILKEHQLPATIYLATSFIDSGHPQFIYALIIALKSTRKKNLDFSSYGLSHISIETPEMKEEALIKLNDYFKNLSLEEGHKFKADLLQQLDLDIEDPIFKNQVLSWDEIREMSDLVSYGGHTVTHPVLSRCGMDRAETEVTQCKATIEKNIGTSVRTFAYPYGGQEDINDGIISLIQKAGYTSAVVLFRKPYTLDNIYTLGRVMVSNAMTSNFFTNRYSQAMFACEMSGLFDLFFVRK